MDDPRRKPRRLSEIEQKAPLPVPKADVQQGIAEDPVDQEGLRGCERHDGRSQPDGAGAGPEIGRSLFPASANDRGRLEGSIGREEPSGISSGIAYEDGARLQGGQWVYAGSENSVLERKDLAEAESLATRSEKRDLASRKGARSEPGRRCPEKRQTLQRESDLRSTFEKLVPETSPGAHAIDGRPLLLGDLEDIDSQHGKLDSKLAQASERKDGLRVQGLDESRQKLGRAHTSRQSRDLDEDGGAGGARESTPAREKKRKPKPRRIECAERFDALDRPIAASPAEARHRTRRSEKRKAEIGRDDDRFRAESFEVRRELPQEPSADTALSSRDEHRRGAHQETL